LTTFIDHRHRICDFGFAIANCSESAPPISTHPFTGRGEAGKTIVNGSLSPKRCSTNPARRKDHIAR